MYGYETRGGSDVVGAVVATAVEAVTVGETVAGTVTRDVDVVASGRVVVGCTATVGRAVSWAPSATAPLTSPAASSAPSAPRVAMRRWRSRRPRLRTCSNMPPSV